MFFQGFDNLQKFGRDSADLIVESIGVYSKGAQEIAVEVSDYSKKSFEDGTTAVEKVLGAKSIENALKVQNEYAKSSFEDFVAKFTQIGDMVANLNKDAIKPFEQSLAKSGK